jgi:superfamily I DNA and/or RNA helicase
MPRLKPCILMSPISVAHYLEPGYPLFNLIVFGEGSQIPVWEAVGAMARGTQGVVAGDPKRLPPTSFFQRGEDPDEEPSETETVEDLESILDDCLSSRLPCLSLGWHYRSRRESLISFSNHHYYRNPSPPGPPDLLGGDRRIVAPHPDRSLRPRQVRHESGGS